MRTLLFVLALLAAAGAQALDAITRPAIDDFLAQEKAYVQEKSSDGVMSLMARDFRYTGRNGDTQDFDAYRAALVSTFMTASKILHKPRVIDVKIADDGQSADVVLAAETKYLVIVGGQRVVTTGSRTRAILVIEDGRIKYKSSQYIGQL